MNYFIIFLSYQFIEKQMFKLYGNNMPVQSEVHITNTYDEITKYVPRQESAIVLKVQQTNYLLHLSYYRFLIDHGKDIIRQFLQQMNKQTKKQTRNLSEILYQISLDRIYDLRCVPELVISELQRLTKKKMQQAILNMEESKKIYYQQVLKQHKQVLQKPYYQCKALESELTIQKLFFLDIYSIFLQQSLSYLKCCKATCKILTCQSINFLFNLNISQDNKLTKIHKQINKYVKYDHEKQFHQLAFIYHLLKIRHRTSCLPQHKLNIKNLFLNIYYKQFRKILYSQQPAHLRVYNFCQVAFLTHEKLFTDFNYRIKFEIINELQKTINTIQAQTLNRQILLIKVKYSIKFDDLHQLRQLIKRKKINEILMSIHQYELIDKSKLKNAIRYIFWDDPGFDAVFSNYGLDKLYNLSQFDRGLPSPQLELFTNEFINFYQEFSQVLCRMLQVEEDHGSQFIIIKRMTLTYEDIKVNLIQRDQGQKALNLECNIILITKREQILSLLIIKQTMNTQRYTKILKQFFETIGINGSNIILLYEYDIGVFHSWRYFYRFINFINNQFLSKVYITNMRKYFEFNEYIIFHMLMNIRLRQASITKNNFYSLIQTTAYETISKLSRKRILYSLSKK